MTEPIYHGDENDLPVGRCYELACNTVLAHGAGRLGKLLVGESWVDKIPKDAKEVLLVHGTPTLTRPPYKPYGHAWVEFTLHGAEFVIDGHLGVVALRHVYYQVGKINPRRVQRYNKAQATDMVVKHNHYGVWNE